MGHKVEIAIYDWGNPSISSLTISGGSHTSVVVFNREFEFTPEGIRSIAPPGSSFKGVPSRVIDVGRTEIDEDTYKDFLDGLQNELRAQTFNPINKNGNTFTSKTIEFLCGATFPAFLDSKTASIQTSSPIRSVNSVNLNAIPHSRYNSVNALPEWPTLNVISKEMLEASIMSNYKAILMTVSPLTTYTSNSVELSQAFYRLAGQRGLPGMSNAFMRLDVMMNKQIAELLGVNEYQPTMFFVFKGGMRVNVWQDVDAKRTMNALTEFLNGV